MRAGERAVGRRVVPIILMGTPHYQGNASGNLVAVNHSAKKVLAAKRPRFSRRQGRRDNRRTGMIKGVATNVIKFHRVGRGSVDDRRDPERGRCSRRKQPRSAPSNILTLGLDQTGGRHGCAAPCGRRAPVNHWPVWRSGGRRRATNGCALGWHSRRCRKSAWRRTITPQSIGHNVSIGGQPHRRALEKPPLFGVI